MKIPEGKMNIVFGCGGDRDTTKRPQMGRIAEQFGDQLWITPDTRGLKKSMKLVIKF